MIVECIGKDKTYLPQCIVKEGLGSYEEDNSITVGKKYVVYAVYTMKFNLQYLICDDYYENKTRCWPMFRPAVFFKIIGQLYRNIGLHVKKLTNMIYLKEQYEIKVLLLCSISLISMEIWQKEIRSVLKFGGIIKI